MSRDGPPPGPWQQMVRGTGWAANAPLAFVLLALVALATLPVLSARYEAPLNRELRDVVEPGRGLVTQIHVALAIEGAAIHDFVEGKSPAAWHRYATAYGQEMAAYRQLASLTDELGQDVQQRFRELRALEQRWHQSIAQSLRVARRDPARSRLAWLEDQHEAVLIAAARLDEALTKAAQDRHAQIDAVERLQRELAVILAVIAFAAGLGVAWLGRRVRVFARQLEQTTASRSRLMRGVGHDLKNPLGAIDGHAELLQAEVKGPLNEGQRESVGRIRLSVRSLLALIDDLLELSKAETGQLPIQLRCTDLADVVRDVVGEHRAAAETCGHRLHVHIDDGLPTVDTDPDRVRQVLGNLMSNAVKYTPSGGSILVRLGERSTDGPLTRERWAAIDVVDSGPGIPVDKLDDIFEEFSRLEQGTKPGAGLGLTIARRISRFLGGDVTVVSGRGAGATFTLWLPVDRRGMDGPSVDLRRA